MKTVIRPMAKTPVPKMGTIQCVCALAAQPYQNKPMGMAQQPKTMGGRRDSGVKQPLAEWVRAI